ncbi:zinc ribbon domain-containing protein YjdM [Falseniella ignava]|uniref:Alkylphosphonate utilization operon protein PhnA n=2 Tax=Falseniella ignava TaxID=137730 RepID=K1LND5_9LACT|nr:zinc ribbon domain-containing protein YjdM [Falseniella ignava]EKB53632.1 hypothetical protein HMPREF9707_01385 [Falseniella ignava CCUG 37419]PKY87633.1 alkylphosphonate utilization protein [Falseniella ignava]
MSQLPHCPKCDSDLTYTDGNLMICPMCGHEWTEEEHAAALEAEIIRDANGTALADGDNVSVIREIKLKGSNRIKQGTRVTNIRLLDHPVDGHDIECTIDGFGRMYLKSELVKKI